VPFTAGHDRVDDGEAASDDTAVDSELDRVRVLVRDHVDTDDHERVLVRVLEESVDDSRDEELARVDDVVIKAEMLLEESDPVEEVEELRVLVRDDDDELVEVLSGTTLDDEEAGEDDAGEDDSDEDLTADEDAEPDAEDEEDLVVGMIGTETGPATLIAAFVLPS
jgi:hypothetical protein